MRERIYVISPEIHLSYLQKFHLISKKHLFNRIEANGGVLTNFEVLNFLRSRGATIDPLGCLGAVAPSECKESFTSFSPISEILNLTYDVLVYRSLIISCTPLLAVRRENLSLSL